MHSRGVGTKVRSTSIISDDEEHQLWSCGILGTDSPLTLLRTVFFYVGKRFCIRGGEEQRNLGPSQLLRSLDPDCLTFVEHGSKNRSGRANELHLKNKEVLCPAIPENRPRCMVYLMDLYLSKLPKYAFENDILYLRPKKVMPSDESEPWYENVPVGKNVLSSMVKNMCLEGGIAGKSNHSLRASGATAMFQNGVPEKIIQKVTGHRSLEALCEYERVSTDQNVQVSKILMSNCHQVKNGEPLVSDSEYSCRLAFGFGGMHSCSIGQVVVNINKKEVKKEDD